MNLAVNYQTGTDNPFGARVQLEAGNYIISSTLVAKPGTSIVGAGPRRTMLTRNADVTILDFSGTQGVADTNIAHNLAIRDLEFNSTSRTFTNATGLSTWLTPMFRTYYAQFVHLERVNFRRAGGCAWSAVQLWDVAVKTCRFDYCGDVNHPAVWIRRNDAGVASGFGFSTDTSNNLHFDPDCVWESNPGTELYLDGRSSDGTHDQSHRINMVWLGGRMESMQDAERTPATRCIIENASHVIIPSLVINIRSNQTSVATDELKLNDADDVTIGHYVAATNETTTSSKIRTGLTLTGCDGVSLEKVTGTVQPINKPTVALVEYSGTNTHVYQGSVYYDNNPGAAALISGTPTSYVTTATGGILSTEKGATNGVATLDGAGLIPTSQNATGVASTTTFLRGDRQWVPTADVSVAINQQSGNYTLQPSDAALVTGGRYPIVYMTNSTPMVITVPANLLSTPGRVRVLRGGTGSVSFVGSGATLFAAQNLFSIANQYDSAELLYIGSNVWFLDGDLTTDAIAGTPPIVTTGAVSGVTTTAATLNGSVNPNGAATTYQFAYGLTTSYGSVSPSAPASIGSGSTGVAVTAALSALASNTTYHYQLSATNASGTQFGPDATFTTNAVVSGAQLFVSPTGSDTTGNGTSGAPYRTLGRANTAATPGTTINVAAGSYGQATLSTSGTSTSRIRYLSTTLYGAKCPFGITVTGDYVDVEGFEVDGTITPVASATNNVGIWMQGNFDRAIHNYVHNADIADSSAGGAGILAAGFNYDKVSCEMHRNLVVNIGLGDIAANARVHGIYISEPDAICSNNVVGFCVGDAITSWHGATRLKITNNTVFNSRNGILIGSGDAGATSAGNQNSYVANNISFSNVQSGTNESTSSGFTVTGCVYTNNMGYDNAWGSGANAGHAAPLQTTFNTPASNTSNPGGVTGQLIANPLFVNIPTPSLSVRPNPLTDYDVHLTSASTAVNSGTTVGAIPTIDFDGAARVSPDRGAYEYLSGGSSPVLMGYTGTVGTTAGNAPAGEIDAVQFIASRSGTATKIELQLNGTANTGVTSVFMGLYADSAGAPGTRLATVQVSGLPAPNALLTGTISTAITAGTTYWVAWVPIGGTLNWNVGTGAGIPTVWTATGNTSLPTPFPTVAGSTTLASIGVTVQT